LPVRNGQTDATQKYSDSSNLILSKGPKQQNQMPLFPQNTTKINSFCSSSNIFKDGSKERLVLIKDVYKNNKIPGKDT
jgi:hypothetical protein